MGDRELLELAAKAAGIPRSRWDYDYCRNLGHMVTQSMMWNPLTDDGERYRLAKKLGLQIDFMDKDIVFWVGDNLRFIDFDDEDDARAVLRAAAEIGRNMP